MGLVPAPLLVMPLPPLDLPQVSVVVDLVIQVVLAPFVLSSMAVVVAVWALLAAATASFSAVVRVRRRLA
jgi:hypothetical protein